MLFAGHIASVQVEELLPTVAGPAAGLAMARAWLAVKLSRERDRDR
jgi:hypothetical protein